MTIYTTEKQYDLLKRMLPIMREFYNNNPQPLFAEVAKQYGTPEDAADKAYQLFSMVSVTAPCPQKVENIGILISEVNSARKVDIESPEVLKQSRFVRVVNIPKETKSTLENCLDTFSRVLMGQFFIIYEQLDMKEGNKHVEDKYWDIRWTGSGVREMRDFLIPELRDAGWNGSYGIAGKDNPYDSKLAYEMLKIIRRRHDDYILRITDQPLMIAEGY